MARDKFAKMAFAKVSNAIPSQSESLIAISNRVALLEGENLPTRMDNAEATIANLQSTIQTLQTQITSLLSHRHTYDDSGVSKTTSTPTS